MALFAGLVAAGFVRDHASTGPSSLRRKLLGAVVVLLLLFLAVLLIDVLGGG
jgi:hypothetical protein